MKDYLHFCRLINSEKTSNRFLTAQIKSRNNSAVVLFAVIEINATWLTSAQIGQTIINTLEREYYKGNSTSDLVNFENALRKINETLTQITQNGETQWIGNLNSILALLNDKQIHFASAGNVQAYLIRENKIVEITEPGNDRAQNPQKTFGEITSGTLTLDDKVILSNSSISKYINKEEIKNDFKQNIYFSVDKIASNFQKKKIKDVNLIAISIDAIPVAKKNITDTFYLDKKNVDFLTDLGKTLAPKFKKAGQKFSDGLKIRSEQIKEFSKTKIAPQTQKHLTKANNFSKSIFTPIKNKVAEARQTTLPQKNKEKITAEKIKKDFSVKHYEYYPKAKQRKKLAWLKINPKYFEKLSAFLKSLKPKFSQFILFIKNPKNRTVVYASIIFLLIVVLIANINLLRNKQNKYEAQLTTQEVLASIKKSYTDAQSALIYSSGEKTKQLFNDVIKQANTILDKDPNNQEIKNILEASQKELDQLTSTKRLSTPLFSTQMPADKIYLSSNKLIGISTDNKIYYWEDEAKDAKQYSAIPDSSGNFTTGNTLDSSGLAVFATTKNDLFILKDPILAPDSIKPTDGSWTSAKAIASYLDNLYLLNTQENQIYKYAYSQNGYSAGTPYLTSSTDLSNGVSMSIDGSVYILINDGSVIKLIKGATQNFSLSGVPTPDNTIAQAKQIYTNENIDFIYILDSNRILKFDKDGKFVEQFAFDNNLKNIKSFVLDYTNNKLYVLNDNTVYKFDI